VSNPAGVSNPRSAGGPRFPGPPAAWGWPNYQLAAPPCQLETPRDPRRGFAGDLGHGLLSGSAAMARSYSARAVPSIAASSAAFIAGLRAELADVRLHQFVRAAESFLPSAAWGAAAFVEHARSFVSENPDPATLLMELYRLRNVAEHTATSTEACLMCPSRSVHRWRIAACVKQKAFPARSLPPTWSAPAIWTRFVMMPRSAGFGLSRIGFAGRFLVNGSCRVRMVRDNRLWGMTLTTQILSR
jgi:hypothetical protein